MSDIKTYKDLLVWQKGIEIVKEIYILCNDLPKDEVYGLQSQMKRSSISIPSNIAEGYGRNYTKSYVQFLKIARGSLLELETQVIISKELALITQDKYDNIINLITEENKMLNAFIKSISE
ncbi:MAG TPA: four helix bundle protein [Flavobacteriaceae bacterium]|nr:four helix bundle protein [Flavobacteriaceae bacterium]